MRVFFVAVIIILVSNTSLAFIDPDIEDAFEEREIVKVIVTENAVGSVGIQEIRNVSDSSFIAAVTMDEFEELKNSPGVSSVTLVPIVVPFLAESAPLVNATSVWNFSVTGTKINGTGETICVIDTGVNASHPSLSGKVIGGYNYCANESCTAENTDFNDTYGHGTHVAGIAASMNGTYRGVAPGASIVSMRVFNSTGGAGTMAEVESAMRWCTNNATLFNISVISMSLGTSDRYSGFCDASFDGGAGEVNLTGAINNATFNNISIIAASGNNGDTSGIMSSPACIKNATAVGSVYDADVGSKTWSSASCTDSTTAADVISCFTNRAAALDLLAPGSVITSLSVAGGVTTNSGTSMSAPHVSGAFAILRQYKRLENGTVMLPSAILDAFNRTGRLIQDTVTQLNFTRINIFAALLDIDTKAPSINVTSPVNQTYFTTNISINYTVGDEISLDKCWYTNSTGSNISLGCTNITFIAAIDAFNEINVSANDSRGNINTTQIFFSTDIRPVVNITSPSNLTYNYTNITLNFSASANNGLDLCWFMNTTNDERTNLTQCRNITFIAKTGQNNITVLANDTLGNENSSIVFFSVDLVPPSVILQSPTPNNESFTTTRNLTVNVTSSDFLNSSVLNLNGTLYNMTLSGTSANFTANLTHGNYTFNVTLQDRGGNVNMSGTRWLFINITRNETSFIQNINSTANASSSNFTFINSAGQLADINNVLADESYTFRFNTSGLVAEILNFTWYQANTSNVVNVTRNITLDNVTSNFTSAGGVVDDYVWVNLNSFLAENYTAYVSFPRLYRIYYYMNGTPQQPNMTRFTTECNSARNNTPCFVLSANSTSLYLSGFSGAAAGNDTKAPELGVQSPSGTYTSSNISLNFTAGDNVVIDSCWYKLNSDGNSTLGSCRNVTFIAASGSNTIIVGANDSSGNANHSTVTFTYSAPSTPSSPSSSSSSGGGGGASSTPVQNKTEQPPPVVNVTHNKTEEKPVVLCLNATTFVMSNGSCVMYNSTCDVPVNATVVDECPAAPVEPEGIGNVEIIAISAGIVVVAVVAYLSVRTKPHHTRIKDKKSKVSS